MRNAIYLDPALVPAALRSGYNGKQFKAIVCTEMTIPADAGLWGGGSRDQFRAIEFATGDEMTIPGQNTSPWNESRRERHVALKPGFAIVEHTIFQGKDLGLTFYIHPDNATAMLPPAHDITPHERVVLRATASLKSSYNGRDRYDMARDEYSICKYLEANGATYPSREQWDTAKQSLIGKALLNKAGAITPAGRNAAKS